MYLCNFLFYNYLLFQATNKSTKWIMKDLILGMRGDLMGGFDPTPQAPLFGGNENPKNFV